MKIITWLLVCSLGASSVSAAESQLPSLSNDTAYLTKAPKDLYEQPMVDTPAFQELSKYEQDRKLVQAYKKKKYSPLWRQLKVSGVQLGVTGAMLAAFVGAIKKFSGKQPKEILYEDQSIAKTVVGGTVVTIMAGTLIHLYSSIAPLLWNKTEDPLLHLEVDYIKKRRFLPQDFRNSIEKQFHASRIDSSRVGKTEQFVWAALNLPTSTTKAVFDPIKIDQLFKGYPSDLRRQVETFSLEQVLLQQPVLEPVLNGASPRPGKRLAGYLYGPPGTGKSRYAELIAHALNVPFATLSLEGATLEDLIGRGIDTERPTPGKLVMALANAKLPNSTKTSKNMVLLIDEADRVINPKTSAFSTVSNDMLAWALKLLDPEQKTFHSPYFNADIDISHLTIILAGNYPIDDEALKKRLFVIEFPGFSAEAKKQIIWESTLPKFMSTHSQNKKYLVNMEDLTEDDFHAIDELIALDQDPGFRAIESALMQYVTHVAYRKYFDSEAGIPKHLKMMIEESNSDLQKKTEKLERERREQSDTLSDHIRKLLISNSA